MNSDFEDLFEELRETVKNHIADHPVIDDHTDQRRQIDAAVVYQGHVCPLIHDNITCLNPILIDGQDGPHLSRGSIGGNVDARRGVRKGVEEYNRRVDEMVASGIPCPSDKITEVWERGSDWETV